jgi:SAM-dependent methyltransferase
MRRQALYRQLADYYDKFYWAKDYAREVDFLARVFARYGVKVRDILEVASGTGSHARILVDKGFRVTGIDINEEMLRIARAKLGGRAEFIRGDMRKLEDSVSGGRYDAVVCLFSSISYNQTISDLAKTLASMYECTKPGGLLAFDTHFTRRIFMDGYRGEDIFDDGNAMGARLSISKRRGNLGELSFSYLIHEGQKTILLRNDVHRLGLFDQGELLRETRKAGFEDLKVYHDWSLVKQQSPDQFGDIIFVGRKPPQ